MGLGVRYIREESSANAAIRLVVFHHRGRFPAARDQPLAAGAAGRFGIGAVGGCGGVPAFWLDVLEVALLFCAA